jgi:hypothetical protein
MDKNGRFSVGDEGRKFLRYLMPGLVYGVETLLFLYIVLPEFAVCMVANFRDKDGLGAIVGVFLASGGLGYIFAAVHHYVQWHSRFDKEILNHSRIIEKLRHKEKIPFDNEDLARLDRADKADKRETRKIAESLSLALWYRLLKKEHKLGTNGIDQLRNQAHALGTARIASVFALVTTIGLSMWHGIPDVCHLFPAIRYVVMLILGVGTIWMFDNSYRRVALFAQKAYDETLTMLWDLELSSQAIADLEVRHKNGDEDGPIKVS